MTNIEQREYLERMQQDADKQRKSIYQAERKQRQIERDINFATMKFIAMHNVSMMQLWYSALRK